MGQWRVHAAHLVKACIPLAADDLRQNSCILRATRCVTELWKNKPKAQKKKKKRREQIVADTHQCPASTLPVLPSIHKHCVDLIAIAGHKLVPLAVKL